MAERSKTVCSVCDGRGWVVPADAYKPGTPDSEKCTACNGEGFTYD